MEEFEVIIIGAGPAGLKCAEILGASGRSVLVLEKNKVVGPKVCAGGLTKKTFEYLNLPDSLIEFRSASVWLHLENKKIRLTEKDDFIYTVDREKVGQWQAAKLRAYPNVRVETGAFVSEIGADYVQVGERKIAYRFLVGADGSSSVVRKYLGLSAKGIGVGLQYLIPNNNFQDLELFFRSEFFGPWYAWIFPHREYVSVGCGADPKYLPTKNLVANFQAWLEEKKIDVSGNRLEAAAINTDYRGHRFGNIFLAGDAAGLASGLTGEGIYQALVSGEEVARTIIDPKFTAPKIQEVLRDQKKHQRALWLLIRAGRFQPVVFWVGRLLLKNRHFREKIIKDFG